MCVRVILAVVALALVFALNGCKTKQASTEAPAAQESEASKTVEPSQDVSSPQETEEPVDVARKLGTETDADVVAAESGLQYIDVKVGDGDEAKSGEVVSVHYTGWLVSGKKFDSSVDRGQPFEFPLGAGRVIKGWDEGVAGMKVGGIRKLIIPSDLGYGNRSVGPIPAGSTLISEVELLGVK